MGLMQVTIPEIESVQQGGTYLNPIDLKGSMTIEEGSTYVGKNLTEFYAMMEIPESVPANILLKEIQNYVPGYDFHAIKAK
jgi:hypothetical protein